MITLSITKGLVVTKNFFLLPYSALHCTINTPKENTILIFIFTSGKKWLVLNMEVVRVFSKMLKTHLYAFLICCFKYLKPNL